MCQSGGSSSPVPSHCTSDKNSKHCSHLQGPAWLPPCLLPPDLTLADHTGLTALSHLTQGLRLLPIRTTLLSTWTAGAFSPLGSWLQYRIFREDLRASLSTVIPPFHHYPYCHVHFLQTFHPNLQLFCLFAFCLSALWTLCSKRV